MASDRVDLETLLEQHWGLVDATATPLDGGMNSDTWLVEHRGTTYVAKRVPRSDVDSLVSGCEVATALGELGFRTGAPLPTVDGRRVLVEQAMAVLEHVPGRELDGEAHDEQRWIAETLAAVHEAGRTGSGPDPAPFMADWIDPDVRGVSEHPWLSRAVQLVRTDTSGLDLTWTVLHSDPAPEAFVRDDVAEVTGLIDWTGSRRGPALYDVASAVMYLGGLEDAATFLATYRAAAVIRDDEWEHLDAFRRFREAIQGSYFARRIATNDLTGGIDPSENEKGLADARRRLAALGVATD